MIMPAFHKDDPPGKIYEFRIGKLRAPDSFSHKKTQKGTTKRIIFSRRGAEIPERRKIKRIEMRNALMPMRKAK